MITNANTLRTLVLENRFTLGRLSKDTIGEDYKELSDLYRAALDALTIWASKDYSHTSTQTDVDRCFDRVKDILNLFTTDDNRITIDKLSMRTMRDCATKPKRLYSPEYTNAMKALKSAKTTVSERLEDLKNLGIFAPNEDETLEDYKARVRATNINTHRGEIDMLEMYASAVAVLGVKAQDVEDVKARGNFAWKRPVAVTLTEFAELVENYVGDCLEDGYNLKSSDVVRAEKAAARAAANANA